MWLLKALLKAARECRAPPDYPENVKRAFLNGVKEPEGPPDEGVSLITSLPTGLKIPKISVRSLIGLNSADTCR